MEEELVKEIERLTEENERLQIAFDSVLDRYSDAHQERVKLRDKLREMEIK